MPARIPSQRSSVAKRPLFLWLLAGGVGLVSLWLLPHAWRQMTADLIAAPARVTINPQAGQAQPVENAQLWRAHRQRLETALEIQPDNAIAHADLAALHMAAVAVPDLSEDELVENRLAAIVHFREATHLRPADPRLWLGLARAYLMAGDLGAGFQEAWQRAAILGPHEAVVHTGLFEMALLIRPPAALPAMADWVHELYESADERKRAAMRRIAESYEVAIDDEGRLSLMAVPEAEAGADPAAAPAPDNADSVTP
ncbi:hypothetical protein [Nevskia sp.]|uniref:hypothetical protein n=1 Tax=Nevskia sp. TaxID=1929292 RepID=UPI0025F920AC|nr:hypothetical protein [Nevskia sp.]